MVECEFEDGTKFFILFTSGITHPSTNAFGFFRPLVLYTFLCAILKHGHLLVQCCIDLHFTWSVHFLNNSVSFTDLIIKAKFLFKFFKYRKPDSRLGSGFPNRPDSYSIKHGFATLCCSFQHNSFKFVVTVDVLKLWVILQSTV